MRSVPAWVFLSGPVCLDKPHKQEQQSGRPIPGLPSAPKDLCSAPSGIPDRHHKGNTAQRMLLNTLRTISYDFLLYVPATALQVSRGKTRCRQGMSGIPGSAHSDVAPGSSIRKPAGAAGHPPVSHARASSTRGVVVKDTHPATQLSSSQVGSAAMPGPLAQASNAATSVLSTSPSGNGCRGSFRSKQRHSSVTSPPEPV